MSNELDKHWDSIFSTTNDRELGWYEENISQTIKLLKKIPEHRPEEMTIFIPGAGTSLLVDELLDRGYNLILNDISECALKKLKERLGDNSKLTWLHHDITLPLPSNMQHIDIWIDRAVLHFLLEENVIQQYFSNLKLVLNSSGYVILAEFSKIGATKCAGLELHRYSIEEMISRLGDNFKRLYYEDYTYINPYGDPRPYIYAIFKNKA